MSEVQAGPWTLVGTDTQVEILLPMYAKMAGTLVLPNGSWRVKPARVVVTPRSEMPWARKPTYNPDGSVDKPGVRATGYWDGTRQRIAADQFDNAARVRKIGAHETTHQLDDQWMMRSHQRDIKPLFDPDPAGWAAEEFAVYGSAAIFGFTDPPYTDFYDNYVIAPANWPKVKQIALRDDRPTDPCLPYKAQIETLTQSLEQAELAVTQKQAELDVANAEIERLSLDLEQCAESLSEAKANAQETIDLPTPTEE